MELYNPETKLWVFAGNCTIPANHEVPPVGAVCEIKYLYARKATGALYQPVFLSVRDDVDWRDCSVAQLKYKAGDNDDTDTTETSSENNNIPGYVERLLDLD
jgi:ATP-dependent DNA ligase